jgi:phosphate starvation-inducible PhoH-like protein
MALAIRALMEKQVKRIVLTRPAVEAGERLGFLPGSMEEKVSPTCGRSTTRSTT